MNSLAILLVTPLSVWLCSAERYVDLSHEVSETSMIWPGSSKPLTREANFNGYTDSGHWLEYYHICLEEHVSTHMDAPLHFAEGKWAVADIPLEHLIAQGVVVDIEDKVRQNPLAQLTPDDLRAWQDTHGLLPDGAVVFVRTGWGRRYGNTIAYYGSTRNDSLSFPGVSVEAARVLSGYEQTYGRRVFGVAIDGPSMDYGPAKVFPAHVELAMANIYGLENVANMEQLPLTGFQVIVMPLKLAGGSGIATRILASIPTP